MYVPGPSAPGGYKDELYVANWTGAYVGVNAGYAWSANSSPDQLFESGAATGTVPLSGLSPSGGFGGGQIGYNWQGWMHPSLVLGVEADFQGAGINQRGTSSEVPNFAKTGLDPFTYSSKSSLDWFGTVRARLGYAFGPALLYATGGFAYGGVRYTGNALFFLGEDFGFSGSSTATGYTVGGGVEYKIAPAWSVKAEYQHIDLGSETFSSPIAFVVQRANVKVDNTYDTARVGLNYHVGSTFEPLK